MDKTKNKLVKDIVYKFAELSKITDTKMCDNLVEKLLNLDTDDSIDTILVSLNSLLNTFLVAPNFIQNSCASFTCPKIWSSPTTSESKPAVTSNKC